jgi:hypothetical protein
VDDKILGKNSIPIIPKNWNKARIAHMIPDIIPIPRESPTNTPIIGVSDIASQLQAREVSS